MTGPALVSPDAPGDSAAPPPRQYFPLLALVLLVLLVLLYGPTSLGLVRDWWDDPDYSHGFVVPVFAGFMIAQRRRELMALEPSTSWAGLALLLVGLATLLLGDFGAELFLTRSSLVVVLAGLVLLHLGPSIFRIVRFPLAYLLFMIPLPATLYYAVTFPLQRLAARSAAWTLDRLDIPVLLEGNIIHLTQLSLGIAEACSGIRSLLSLVAVAVAWAYFLVPGRWAQVILVGAAFPIAVFGNVCRVLVTALVATWLGGNYAEGFYHLFSGWVVFLAALTLLATVDHLLRLGSQRRVG